MTVEKALVEAAEVIGYARDFVDGFIDVEDGDYGIPRPNKAMQLAQQLDEAMSLVDAALNDPSLAEKDGRPRGNWGATPRWMFWKPKFRRPVYAHWQIGGGLDEWEYSASQSPNR